MFLQGERVRLRGPENEDIDRYLRWFNDPAVYQYIQRYRPIGRKEEEEFIANLHKKESDFLFVIVVREGDAVIGCCGLHQVSLPNRSAELGIVIGEKEYWNKGYGREVVNLLCGYGFRVLNLHRIGLNVYEYNERGIRCYERVGFREEGRRRESRFWEGRYWDIVDLGILASEWNGANERKGEQ